MLSKLKCVAFHGLDVVEVTVEVSVSRRGMPVFTIVGLPNKSVEESKHRIKSAFVNSGFDFPDAKITVNLAPADIHKIGSGYDLPVAAGIFCAINNISSFESAIFFGELSLDGLVRATRGSYLVIDYVKHCLDKKRLFISAESLFKMSHFDTDTFYGVTKLSDLFAYFLGKVSAPLVPSSYTHPSVKDVVTQTPDDIVGQDLAKRALEICAAGGHNLLLLGSPGTGKSMLAKSVAHILPELAEVELSEVRKIYSYIGQDAYSISNRPFRSPHHTISYSGMVGGGNNILPGEISLSHNGILFMDEFCEFSRNVLESLRQPLQDGKIGLTRNNMTYVFPSRFTLIGAANPCPCGYLGHSTRQCTCTEQRISSYSRKLSGPLSDRFDLFVNMFPEDSFFENVSSSSCATFYTQSKNRVAIAKNIQNTRLQGSTVWSNAFMSNNDVNKFCTISTAGAALIRQASTALSLSPRAYFKVIKVARTIADLDQSSVISDSHVAEALQYRQR